MTRASRIRTELDIKFPTKNVGVVGNKLQSPSVGFVKKPIPIGRVNEEAEQKLLGGFNRNRQCVRCGLLLTKSNWCVCVDDGLEPLVAVRDGRKTKKPRTNDVWLEE